MPETHLPQFPVHLHFHDGCLGTGDIVDHSRQQDHGNVSNHKGNDGSHAALAHEGIQGIPLELGNGDVHEAADNGECHHHQDLLPNMIQIWQDSGDSEEFQMLLFRFHDTAPSWESLWVS